MKTPKIEDGTNIGYASKLGIMEWFHKDDYDHVERATNDLTALGIKELRTGFSWADFHTDEGKDWYDWLIPKLAAQFNILPCLTYTPPSIGLEPSVISPPVEPIMFADFTDMVINRYGDHFEYIELWNEPNNISAYNFRLDPAWERFAKMIVMSSYWAKHLGKKTVLGGMSPIDPHWLSLMAEKNMLKDIDVIGIHGFPQVFDPIWSGWLPEIERIKQVLDFYGSNADIWITETGYSTWKHDEQNQILRFMDALECPVNRVYWYSLFDLSPARSTMGGFHQDEREYHFGMKDANGQSKLLFRKLTSESLNGVNKEDLVRHPVKFKAQKERGILITGGAGFIGTNLADKLLSREERVIIYDNLSRNGVENNLHWLVDKHPQVEVMIADVKDFYSVQKAVDEAKHVFHFAAQVAVTNSLVNPDYDYQVNVGGTIHVLEAIRLSSHKPSAIFTSTNKVYGDLTGLELESNSTRYFPTNPAYFKNGINESFPLSFHSPYGCSKGSADQYVLDYSRSFGIHALVFRMSCIYGPHQFGTEDQGWIAHFINQSIQNKKIVLYGDGKQVRDILYVDDLIEAFLLARQNIRSLAGEAFNMGGGPENAISLIELLAYMDRLDHLQIRISLDAWRTGDQKYYVSDTRKFKKSTGWHPKVKYTEGIVNLLSWLHNYHESQMQHEAIIK